MHGPHGSSREHAIPLRALARSVGRVDGQRAVLFFCSAIRAGQADEGDSDGVETLSLTVETCPISYCKREKALLGRRSGRALSWRPVKAPGKRVCISSKPGTYVLLERRGSTAPLHAHANLQASGLCRDDC